MAELRAILARLDAGGGHPIAAIHIQWAIELIGGEITPADPPWGDDG